MLTRRSFLSGISILALSRLLLSCKSGEPALRIRFLENSVPPQLLKEFQRQVAKNSAFSFSQIKQLVEAFELLQNAQKQSGENLSALDLVTLGDFWLTPAISQGLIQPLPLSDIPEWQQLPKLWKNLVQRDRQGRMSETGEFWAAPYRWGSLMMVYRPEVFQPLGWVPSDWGDLWRSELKGRISLLDSPRAVIGLTLKKLGQSVNLSQLQSVANLPIELKSLQQQVKFYSSNAYLQPLITEDTWLAVGWSHEILPVLKRDRQLAAAVPKSGTLLTADLWVRPATPTAPTANATTAARLTLIKQWMSFCWQPKIAAQISLLSSATSPIFWGEDAAQIPASLTDQPLLLPAAEIQQRSEFLLPLEAATIAAYRQLWTAMRSS